MIYLRRSIIFLCILYLTSCASPHSNIPNNYALNNKSGVILLSLTASGECGYAYFTEIREIYSGEEYSVGMQDFGKERDWKNNNECPSEPNNYFGKLVALELPVGTYQLHRLEGVSKYKRVFSEHEMKIQFSVKPGKINYLGNIHFHVKKKSFIYGAQNLGERDIPLFLKKYNQFNSGNIITNIIRLKATKVLTA